MAARVTTAGSGVRRPASRVALVEVGRHGVPRRHAVDSPKAMFGNGPALGCPPQAIDQSRPEVPRLSGIRHPVVRIHVEDRDCLVAVDVDPDVGDVMAGSLVLRERPGKRSLKPLTALIDLAGHDLGHGVLSEQKRGAFRVVGIDPVEVADEDLPHVALVDEATQGICGGLGHPRILPTVQ